MPDVTPSLAKRIMRAVLAEDGRTNKLTARTVSFSDLARASCIFVTVHGWTPAGPGEADQLKALAVRHGFRVEFA